MKLSNSFIAVKKIKSSVPRSNFSENELSRVAELILKVEGVINPLILRRNSPQSYEVVDGNFEYHAAVKAKEIDSQKGEYISAFIIEPENEEVLEEQVKLLRSQNNTSNKVLNIEENKDSISMELRVSNAESRMTNIESRFENRMIELQTEFKYEIGNLNQKLKELGNKIPQPMEPLVALNTLKLHELVARLKRVNVKTPIIEKIIKEREANGNFTSFSNVVERIKGLGDKTMLKIIDSFSEATI
ncbi:hypothetical protein [Nostoc sp. CCY0012]|uniref:ParB N-terminal domain-containing protein n=1 Tax=Nostoc sp. CCY0012 TaxID=1056123 RepID=UPI0039C70CA4